MIISKKIKVMSVFGTRPEAIKMAPLVKNMENEDSIKSIVCVTAQHREMLDQVLDLFDIVPDYDLNIMKEGQSLSEITTRVILGLEGVMKAEKPDVVLVHGDTTTAFSAALAAFYNGIKVGHVEAGLRSFDKFSPYPEEMNRGLVGKIADFHFSPTKGNRNNLLSENINEKNIFITGNTVIDALFKVVDNNFKFENERLNSIDYLNKRVILLTAHRRENLGRPMENIFSAVRKVVDKYHDTIVVFPMHLNPKVREIAYRYLDASDRIFLIEPMEYQPFSNLIERSYFILTDSGGIQEEAPALGKPVLVLRRETERPEAVEAGTVKIAGVEEDDIINLMEKLLNDKKEYDKMANSVNPYGDGKASERIVNIIKNHL